jgi:hypothetical protein
MTRNDQNGIHAVTSAAMPRISAVIARPLPAPPPGLPPVCA